MLSLMANTGSEQGKKRKRQDSTKELQNGDVKETVPKQKKKAKLGGQDSNDTGEASTDASNTKRSAKTPSATGKDGKSNTWQNSGGER